MLIFLKYLWHLSCIFQLDAKKSPLALLAQTCSSIGKDSTPGKNIIPPLEKKDDKKKESQGKIESPQRTSTPEERPQGRDSVKRDSGSPRDEKQQAPPSRPKELPPLVPISSSSSSSSTNDKATPPPSSEKEKSLERDSSSAPATSNSSQQATNSRISLSCGNMLLEVNHHETNSTSSNGSSVSSSAVKTTTTSSTATTPALPKPGDYPSSLHGHLGATYPGCALPLLGHHIPVDTATATPIHPAAISVHSSMGLSAAQKGLPSAHGLSPYTYARVKSASGATTLVPICRDPYCTNCQLTMTNAQYPGTCAAGCTQCNHDKTHTALPTSLASSYGSHLGTIPVLPLGASALTPSASALASSYYSHAFSMLPGHHTLPYVCNWMAGSDYCGKRFTTSEELLQHLRTHTSSADSAALASLYPGLGLSAAAAHASLAACHTGAPPHYPPGSLSPNSLRQAYPRSLSPNSLLAAARYHPYKSPLSLPTTLPSAAGLPSAALPAGLAPYYSSYALYGQRLGAAAP